MGEGENHHVQELCLSLDAKQLLAATLSGAYCFLSMQLLKTSFYFFWNIVQELFLAFEIQRNNT